MPSFVPYLAMRERNSMLPFINCFRSAIVFANGGVSTAWTNMPAAITDVFAGTGVALGTGQPGRATVCLTYWNFLTFTTTVTVVGTAASVLFVQYSTDGGANWTTIAGSTISLATLGGKQVMFTIPDACKNVAEVLLRIVGQNGDGVADPAFNSTGVFAGWVRSAAGDIAWPNPPNALENIIMWANSTMRNTQQLCGIVFNYLSNATWTNMPNAQTEYLGTTANRPTIDFTGGGTGSPQQMIKQHVGMRVAGAANAVIKFQYSLNAGSTWQFIDSETTNTGAPVNVGALGMRESSGWIKVDQAAMLPGGVLCRAVGSGGDGALDPNFFTWLLMTQRFNP